LYAPESEGTVLWNDPDLAIAWPIADAILSDRDRRGQPLRAYLGAPAFTAVKTV
jgi:dTDP-4-dehydrorhamnose 3,5-epimerase